MKKIILAIFTIMLTLAIFGCGKAQQVGGGGSSSGGGGGGGTPQTFSVEGKVYGAQEQAQTSGMSTQAAGDYTIKVLQFTDDTPWVDGTWTPDDDGKYQINGLPLGTVFVVVVEKGNLKMKNLAFSNKAETKTADLTPTSTVTVEVISANAAARQMLENFNENINIDAAVTEVQDGVDKYYKIHTDELDNLRDAADNGNEIPLNDVNTLKDDPNVVQTYALTVDVNPVNSGTVIPNSGTYLKKRESEIAGTGIQQ
jgi:hypothetical protein